jgi:hypothetical protein
MPKGGGTMREVVGVESARVEKLGKELEQLLEMHRQRHGANYRANAVLIGFGIVGSISVSATGLLGYPTAAGILGLMVALCIGLQNAYAFGEKAEYQRIVATEAENLLSRLQIEVKGESDFEKLFSEFLVLRTSAAKNIPRGKTIEAVREMATELQAKR